jgi:hypothetical protein
MQFNLVVNTNSAGIRCWQHHGFQVVGTSSWVSWMPLPRSIPIPWAQASTSTRRRGPFDGVGVGLADLVLGFFPTPRALAAEHPAGPAALGAAELPASNQGVR